jgi:hypothetical protein
VLRNERIRMFMLFQMWFEWWRQRRWMDSICSWLEKCKKKILQRMKKTTWERRLVWEYNIKMVLRDTDCEQDFSGSSEGRVVRFYAHGCLKTSGISLPAECQTVDISCLVKLVGFVSVYECVLYIKRNYYTYKHWTKSKRNVFLFNEFNWDHSTVKRGTIEPGEYAAQITLPLIGLRKNKHCPIISVPLRGSSKAIKHKRGLEWKWA